MNNTEFALFSGGPMNGQTRLIQARKSTCVFQAILGDKLFEEVRESSSIVLPRKESEALKPGQKKQWWYYQRESVNQHGLPVFAYDGVATVEYVGPKKV